MFKRIVLLMLALVGGVHSPSIANPVVAAQGIVVDSEGRPLGPIVSLYSSGNPTVKVLTRIGERVIDIELSALVGITGTNVSSTALVVGHREQIWYTGYGCTGRSFIGNVSQRAGVRPVAQRGYTNLIPKEALVYISDIATEMSQEFVALSYNENGTCRNWTDPNNQGGTPIVAVIDLYKYFKPPFSIR